MANRRRKQKPDTSQPAPSSQQESSSSDSTAEKGAAKKSDPQTTAAGLQPLLQRLPSLSRIMSVVMLMIGIVAVGALFYQVMAGFFVPLFLATLLVVIFRPFHAWVLERTGGRTQVAALSTTALVFLVVLFPVIMVISVAASQFTAMVSHFSHYEDLSDALDRVRGQLGVSLPHNEQFLELEFLSNSLDSPDQPQAVLENIAQAKSLVTFLESNVQGPPTSELKAEEAEAKLTEFSAVVRERIEHIKNEDRFAALQSEEVFHQQSLGASDAIRDWMTDKLGGSLMRQVKLKANPTQAELAKLVKSGREALQPSLVELTGTTGKYLVQFAISLLILVVSVYFFLLDGPAMIRTLMRLSPMDDNYERRLLNEFDRTSRAVVLASVLSALAQGVLAAIGFWLCGFESIILLFLITTIMALVPFLGATSVWLPCAIWLAAVDQRWTAAILLAIYGAGVVSMIDNVIKVFVLHGRSALHPLFALLSVIGGVTVFGPIGVVVGPMVVVFLQTLLEILNHELISTDTDESHQARAMAQHEQELLETAQ